MKLSPLQLLDYSGRRTNEYTYPFSSAPHKRLGGSHPRLQVLLPDPTASADQRKDQETRIANTFRLAERSSDSLVIFSDGSRMLMNGQKVTGASAVITRNKVVLGTNKVLLGVRHTIYDGELMGASMGAKLAVDWINRLNDEIRTVVLAIDNQSAVRQISDATNHYGQRYSIWFQRHMQRILDNHPHVSYKVAWIRAHQENSAGNNLADRLAKEACQLPLGESRFVGALLSWLREQAKARVQTDWQASAPTCKIPEGMKAIMEAPRAISARALQAMVGHGFFGDFYSRHIPLEWVDCPCGKELQTRGHILMECPEYHEVRSRLDMRSEEWLVTTKEERDKLLAFLEQTNAFCKVSRRTKEEERERFARRRELAAWMIGEDGRERSEESEGTVISGWDSEEGDQMAESGEEEDQGEAKAPDRCYECTSLEPLAGYRRQISADPSDPKLGIPAETHWSRDRGRPR
jgi:ribonuclease HI